MVGVISDTHGLLRPQALEASDLACGVDVVISGHSHKQAVSRRDGARYVNPGSAGPRRSKLPVALARLTRSARSIDARVPTLDVRPR